MKNKSILKIVLTVLALIAAVPLRAEGTGPYASSQWHMVSRTNYNAGLYRVAIVVYSDGRHFYSRRFVY